MLVDLHLKGGQVVVIGGGGEAERKIGALLPQSCPVTVIAARLTSAIKKWADEGKIECRRCAVKTGDCLDAFDRLALVIAATNDRALNRSIVKAAKKRRCYAYAVDDPENSDFSHPAVINLGGSIQVAVSTGGRSPLMAKALRRKIEPLLRELIGDGERAQIGLQERLRRAARDKIASAAERKRFLQALWRDKGIDRLLCAGDVAGAEAAALKKLAALRK